MNKNEAAKQKFIAGIELFHAVAVPPPACPLHAMSDLHRIMTIEGHGIVDAEQALYRYPCHMYDVEWIIIS